MAASFCGGTSGAAPKGFEASLALAAQVTLNSPGGLAAARSVVFTRGGARSTCGFTAGETSISWL